MNKNVVKTIVIIILGILAGLVIADLANNEESKTDSVRTENGVTTTTTTVNRSNAAEEAACNTESQQLVSLWIQLADVLDQATADGTAAYLVEEAKDAINAGVTANRSWIARCGKFDPAKAADVKESTDYLEGLADQM